jgi:predicted DNA-binding protein with PD1-like motif
LTMHPARNQFSVPIYSQTSTNVKDLEIAYALQRTNTEYWKQIFPEKELRGLSPNFHIHVSVSDLLP